MVKQANLDKIYGQEQKDLVDNFLILLLEFSEDYGMELKLEENI